MTVPGERSPSDDRLQGKVARREGEGKTDRLGREEREMGRGDQRGGACVAPKLQASPPHRTKCRLITRMIKLVSDRSRSADPLFNRCYRQEC